MLGSRLLTRKQQWRKQKIVYCDIAKDDGINEMMYKMTFVPSRTSSEQSVGSLLTSYNSRKYASGNDITEAVVEVTMNNKKDKRRNVKFNTAVHVVLIPTRKDYQNAGLGEVMWFSDWDYKSFKESATIEVKRYMAVHSSINCKEALNILYQPISPSQEMTERDNDQTILVPTAVMVDESQLLLEPTTSDTNLSGLLKAKTDVDLIKPSSFNHNVGDTKHLTNKIHKNNNVNIYPSQAIHPLSYLCD